jgi:hypothetical protein
MLSSEQLLVEGLFAIERAGTVFWRYEFQGHAAAGTNWNGKQRRMGNKGEAKKPVMKPIEQRLLVCYGEVWYSGVTSFHRDIQQLEPNGMGNKGEAKTRSIMKPIEQRLLVFWPYQFGGVGVTSLYCIII